MEHEDILPTFVEVLEVGWSVVQGLEEAVMTREVSSELRGTIRGLVESLARSLTKTNRAIEAIKELEPFRSA